MGLFSKLFSWATGAKEAPPKLAPPATKPRPTAADSSAAKGGVKGLKERIAAEGEKLLQEVFGNEGRFLAGLLSLYNGKDFNSSNVQVVTYDPAAKQLIITYQAKGAARQSTYRYSSISPEEAMEMYRAVSKGIQVWDQLRIRGTKYGHKKPYAKV